MTTEQVHALLGRNKKHSKLTIVTSLAFIAGGSVMNATAGSLEFVRKMVLSQLFSPDSDFPWERDSVGMEKIKGICQDLKAGGVSSEHLVELAGPPDRAYVLPRKSSKERDKGYVLEYFLMRRAKSPSRTDRMVSFHFTPSGQLSFARCVADDKTKMKDDPKSR